MRRFLRGTGWSLIGLGCFVLYFLVYQLVGTNAAADNEQHSLRNELERNWTSQAGVPATNRPEIGSGKSIPVGKGIALIQIPKIKVEKVVVQGVSRADLKKGPGHVPSTVMPGQAGTFAVSGHRTTYGAPFFRLNELGKGDIITVIGRTTIYTYSVTSTRIVRPTDTAVLNNVRGGDGTIKSTIVLTTCHPRFSAKQRLIMHGVFIKQYPKDPANPGARPTELTEG
jgi:sortase A